MKKAIPIIAVLLALVSLPLHAQLPELERPNVIPPSPRLLSWPHTSATR